MYRALLYILLFSCIQLHSQNVFIKKGNKLVGFDQLKRIKIYQYKKSAGVDSVNIITDVDSVYKVADTLVVRPWLVEERYLKDTTVEVSVQKLYKASSNALLKIPVNEVHMVVGKKRSISKLFSVTSTVAFVAVAASIPLRLGNSDNQAIGNAMFVTAAPVLIVSWTLQATLAKKRYYFDKARTEKEIWIFN